MTRKSIVDEDDAKLSHGRVMTLVIEIEARSKVSFGLRDLSTCLPSLQYKYSKCSTKIHDRSGTLDLRFGRDTERDDVLKRTPRCGFYLVNDTKNNG